MCEPERQTPENGGQEYLVMPIIVEPMVTQPEMKTQNSIETIIVSSSSNDSDASEGELEYSTHERQSTKPYFFHFSVHPKVE